MTRRQNNNQWSGGIAALPAPKNSLCENPLEKFSPRFLGDQDGILLIDYLPKGQTINVEYYSSLLVQLKGILKEKRRGKVTLVRFNMIILLYVAVLFPFASCHCCECGCE